MAKKTKKSAEKIEAQTAAPAVDYSGNNSQAHRGYPKVRSLVRLLQGRGSEGQRRLRLQNRQERNAIYALAQSPLRSDYLPKRL